MAQNSGSGLEPGGIVRATTPIFLIAGFWGLLACDSDLIPEFEPEECSFEALEPDLKKGSFDTTFACIEKGTSPNVDFYDGTTFIHYAAIADDLETAKKLLSLGAKVDQRGIDERTALHFGCLSEGTSVLC